MSEAARNITVFPATIQRYSAHNASLTEKNRVAGYARVSTDDEEQQTSYEAQVDYYTRYIQSKDEWTFVEVYTDDGVSATNTKRREGFNRMIRDALAGRIDFIVTKSVSRFARNTVDTLTTIRKLKEKGVGVMFEKENIDTLDSKGEGLLQKEKTATAPFPSARSVKNKRNSREKRRGKHTCRHLKVLAAELCLGKAGFLGSRNFSTALGSNCPATEPAGTILTIL